MKKHSLVIYFILTYAISWAVMLPVALSAQGLIPQDVPTALYYLASFGPALSAIILTGATEGRAGLRSLLSRLWKWRVGFRYYAFAVLAPITLFGVAVLANRVIAEAPGRI